MPLRGKEGFRDQNDSLVVTKADGGLVETSNVYQEFGELHSDDDGVSFDLQRKIPVYRPTVLGRPPVQDRMIYYLDEEPSDSGFDPVFMHGKLKSAYGMSASRETRDAEKERNHKRLMDALLTLAGAFLLVFAFFIAPAIGFKIGDAEATESSTTAPKGGGNASETAGGGPGAGRVQEDGTEAPVGGVPVAEGPVAEVQPAVDSPAQHDPNGPNGPGGAGPGGQGGPPAP